MLRSSGNPSPDGLMLNVWGLFANHNYRLQSCRDNIHVFSLGSHDHVLCGTHPIDSVLMSARELFPVYYKPTAPEKRNDNNIPTICYMLLFMGESGNLKKHTFYS